jgi:Tfp pilus assembly protein PilO
MPNKKKQLTATLNKFYEKPVAKVSLELFLSIMAILFFAIFAIRPTLVTMSDLLKEIEDKEALEQQMVQKIAALSTAQSTYLGVEKELSILDQVLPTTPDFINSLKIVEKIASERGILINGISVTEIPKEVESETRFSDLEKKSFSLSLSLSGDYNQIKLFVEEVLDNRRSFITDTVIFSVNEERGEQKLQVTVTLSVPYFGEEQ